MKSPQDSRSHQIEMELKLNELRRSQEELETSRNKYAFLYDFAPVGYFTLERDCAIRSVNLAGERLLGVSESGLIGRRFTHFVTKEYGQVFDRFITQVFASHMKQTCRLRLETGHPHPPDVRIEAMVTESGSECLAVLVDITEKKKRSRHSLRVSTI